VAVRTYLEAISDGLREEMRRDDRVLVIGEDVGVYGGAFKVTKGFQEEFVGGLGQVGQALFRADEGAGTSFELAVGLEEIADFAIADAKTMLHFGSHGQDDGT